MNNPSEPLPGFCRLAFGIFIVCLPTLRSWQGWDAHRGWVEFALICYPIGFGLVWWGYRRLRQVKATYPSLTWWQFLQYDLMMLAVVLLSITALSLLPEEQRQWLLDSFREFEKMLSIARGRP
jgi:dipeptide/tripeptide permease